MCEFERRLIPWIDGELEPDEALETEQHLRVCPVCSKRAIEYKRVSRAFANYCEVVATPKNPRQLSWAHWGAAAAVAAMAAIFILMLRSQVEPFPFERPAIAEAPAIAFRILTANSAAPAKPGPPRPVLKRVDISEPAPNIEPSIEIVIPGEAVFAPGAVPPGISFAAELSIANDGSPRALLLRP
jgi:hypothetical protein